jgi:hypothetical protein
MSVSEGFKYIIPMSAAVEIDPETGFEFIYAKITNPFIREMQSSENVYIDEWKLERDSEGNYIRYNPNDANDVKEMNISKEIQQDIHNAWKLLNPSG